MRAEVVYISLDQINLMLKNTIYIGYKDMTLVDFKYRFECSKIIDEGEVR